MAKDCTEEKREREKLEITCHNCNEKGHYGKPRHTCMTFIIANHRQSVTALRLVSTATLAETAASPAIAPTTAPSLAPLRTLNAASV